ncbi:hypothetical protein FHETE_529 [Fusarium heterosporum]|uniref:Uncharacterized protein n=1 Tax=Fusarium heterosporum TaxID=42747 RepID=A0A8H5X458_FUSHE|nr:hypothetical protein FHETE_529 [Fusarium heterosporum]
MGVSPGSRPPEPFSREPSLTSSGQVEDERDFDKLESIIPDSQTASRTFTTELPRKRFSMPEEEVSLSTMSRGFCFGEKEAPRPGQFSERPKLKKSQQALETLRFFPKPTDFLSGRSPASPRHAPVLSIPRPAAPLDLPEFMLAERNPSSESPPTIRDDESTSPPNEIERYPSISLPEKAFHGGKVTGMTVVCIDSSGLLSNEPPATSIKTLPAKSGLVSSSSQRVEVTAQEKEKDLEQMRGRVEVSSFQSNDRELRLEELKLPLPHIVRVSRNQHHSSPSNACGDLEAPVPQTPRNIRRQDYCSHSHRSGQPSSRSEYQRDSDTHRAISQSRSSNISKKRSSRGKVQSQPTNDQDRKKVAMQNVAQHWNECLQIAEAERHEALRKIARLKKKIGHINEALYESMLDVSAKDSTIQESEARCKTLEAERTLAETKRETMQTELEALRSDLITSQNRAKSLQEKYCKSRAKLNEAIAEQQDLFSRARSLHQETHEELQKERDRRATDAKTVELALEASQKKREELRDCIEKYRAETEQEMGKKIHTISELRTRLEGQQQELVRERDAKVDLQARLETESTLLDNITKIHDDIGTLKNSNDKQRERSEEIDKMASCFSQKLDLMSDQLNTQTKDQLTIDTVKSMMGNLEANIISRLHDGIVEQRRAHSKDQRWREETRRALDEHLCNVSVRTLETQKICNETNAILSELTASHSAWQEGFQIRHSTEFIKQLENRELKIGRLEETLRQVSQDWSKKLDVIRSTMRNSDEQAKECLQKAIREIRTALEDKLQKEKTASEKDISRSEAIQGVVKAHLEQVNLQIERLSSNHPESQFLHKALAEEREKTHALQGQVARFESDSGISDELYQRQRQDLQAIEALKSQLQDMSEQVPRAETLNTTFNKMVDLNQMLQSTALYLSKERHWVDEQLVISSQDASPHNPLQNNTGTESAYFSGNRSEKPVIRLPTQGTDINLSTSLSDFSSLNVQSQGERYRRKVTVASPALEASSTAHPPSVTQEQLRRREAILPRSILRSATTLSQESEPSRAYMNQSQYNRPVMAKRSSVTGFTNPAMVEQIRSGLVQPKIKYPGWEFLTMEDFAKEIQPNSKDDVKSGDKHSIAVAGEAENIAPAMKRVKSEEPQDRSEHAGERDMHRPLMLRTRHVIRKTYSKKQCD